MFDMQTYAKVLVSHFGGSRFSSSFGFKRCAVAPRAAIAFLLTLLLLAPQLDHRSKHPLRHCICRLVIHFQPIRARRLLRLLHRHVL